MPESKFSVDSGKFLFCKTGYPERTGSSILAIAFLMLFKFSGPVFFAFSDVNRYL